jgi:hypothetical protein
MVPLSGDDRGTKSSPNLHPRRIGAHSAIAVVHRDAQFF